ncbi:MAG TPA: hypothetical protein VIN33_07360 [Marinobacter sp.]
MTQDEKFEYWQRHIDAWRRSGQLQRAFCEEHQLRYSTFSYWRTKLNRNRQVHNPWVPVSVSPSTAAVVHLPEGVRLEVPLSALGELLPMVVRTVRDLC